MCLRQAQMWHEVAYTLLPSVLWEWGLPLESTLAFSDPPRSPHSTYLSFGEYSRVECAQGWTGQWGSHM